MLGGGAASAKDVLSVKTEGGATSSKGSLRLGRGPAERASQRAFARVQGREAHLEGE
jgi:hypothetical protein